MSQRIAAKITGVAGYVPPRVVTNADIEKMVDTTDEWIRTRTGIRERHFADPGVASSHLGTEAAKKLLALKGVRPEEIDLIVVATVTPDMLFPATACLIQDRLGANQGLGIRSFRRVLGIRLRADGGRAVCRRGIAQESAGDRRGRDDVHPRFPGPRDLRAVRRRRGRGAAGTGRFGRGRNHRFRPRCRRFRRLQSLHARRRARCIRRRTKPSTSGCTTFTRKASRYSNTRCGG